MELKERSKGGRPRINGQTRALVVRLYNEDELSCREIAQACNISKSSLHRIIREERRKAVNGEV